MGIHRKPCSSLRRVLKKPKFLKGKGFARQTSGMEPLDWNPWPSTISIQMPLASHALRFDLASLRSESDADSNQSLGTENLLQNNFPLHQLALLLILSGPSSAQVWWWLLRATWQHFGFLAARLQPQLLSSCCWLLGSYPLCSGLHGSSPPASRRMSWRRWSRAACTQAHRLEHRRRAPELLQGHRLELLQGHHLAWHRLCCSLFLWLRRSCWSTCYHLARQKARRWMQMREKKSLGVEQLHTCDMYLNVYVWDCL